MQPVPESNNQGLDQSAPESAPAAAPAAEKAEGKNPAGEEDEDEDEGGKQKVGRRKINIEFIEDKSRRHITFSKRKSGIMKKAYELSALTGTQVLLLVASETGHVYTYATEKLQPLIQKPEGKNLIQTCLSAPDQTHPSHQQQQQQALSHQPNSTQLRPMQQGMPQMDDQHRAKKARMDGGMQQPQYNVQAQFANVPGGIPARYNTNSASMYPMATGQVMYPQGQYVNAMVQPGMGQPGMGQAPGMPQMMASMDGYGSLGQPTTVIPNDNVQAAGEDHSHHQGHQQMG
eukprot:TRINITY_DN398_c0_g1_i2.p1 TRINITY_DN398_c0_g1~~TRINITY_DN398_c0_g1_i2.p1  ORF type:complete len:288 (-),score=80.11 TRINITY_DN398_c0_g1_i2:384-1247(-)